MARGAVGRQSFEIKWLGISMLPLGLAALFFLYWFHKMIYRFCCEGVRGWKHLNAHSHGLVGTILIVMSYIYLFMMKNSLDIFNCSRVVSSEGVSDGRSYLETDPSIPCYERGSAQVGDGDSKSRLRAWLGQLRRRLRGLRVSLTSQMVLLPYAICFFCLYSVGYPVFVGYVFFTPATRAQIRKDQLLRVQVRTLSLSLGKRRDMRQRHLVNALLRWCGDVAEHRGHARD
jgi:hypothetical protein